VAMDAATTPAAVNEALIFVQGVVFDVTFTVTLDEGQPTQQVATFSTPLATASPNKLSTTDVAASLRATIDADPDWVAVQIGPVVYVKRDTGAAFTVKVDDDRSNTLARAINGSTENFSDLPLQARGEMVVKIESDPSRDEDDFWVKFVRSDGLATSDGPGTWQETVAPGVPFALDEDTMPLVIYRAAVGKLYIGPADGAARTLSGAPNYTFPLWGQRTAGNEETAPQPSFVGRPIRDHLIHRGRYAVTGGETVVMSQTDDIFAFFQDTSLQVLETDPIDVRASSESSVDLQWLTAAGGILLPTSSQEQFLLRASDQEVLTPRSAVIDLAARIEVESQVRPQAVGPTVAMATRAANSTQFREMQIGLSQLQLLQGLGAGQDLTINVPKYIEGRVIWWDNGENLDYMVVLTDNDPKTIYVYKYLWQSTGNGAERTQSGWSKWTFDGDVRWAQFYDNELHMLVSYLDGLFAVDLEVEELDDPDSPGVYLDRQILYPECNSDALSDNNVSAVYDVVTDRTTFTLPYVMRSPTDVVVRFDDPAQPGLLIGSASSGTQIECATRGDFTGTDVAIGARFPFRYECTRAYLPQSDQERRRIVGTLDGRLQVLTWSIHYNATGEFEVVVQRLNRSIDSRHAMPARQPGILNNQIGGPGSLLRTGVFRVPVRSKNDQCRVIVESESFLPLRLNGYAWEGSYNDRARRLN
jgi:hypothetical protein